jgi:protein-S-isoprenylcysteine O-methyltransferase Ste14
MPWFPLLAALTLFASAGTLEWWPGRWCLRSVGLCWLATLLFLAFTQPGLLRRRWQNLSGQALPWDSLLLHLLRVCLLLLLGAAGVQSGRGHVPLDRGLFGLGLGLLVAGTMLLWCCLRHNPYFEVRVRHQDDQDQRVSQSGPYGWVRHPGYLALIVQIGSLPLMLHSSLALLPWSLCVATLVVRLRREEEYLHLHLVGYPAYQQRVRFRLFPWLW